MTTGAYKSISVEVGAHFGPPSPLERALENRYKVSISIFQGLFRNIVYRYVAFVTILDLFSKDRTFFRALGPNLFMKKKLQKIP